MSTRRDALAPREAETPRPLHRARPYGFHHRRHYHYHRGADGRLHLVRNKAPHSPAWGRPQHRHSHRARGGAPVHVGRHHSHQPVPGRPHRNNVARIKTAQQAIDVHARRAHEPTSSAPPPDSRGFFEKLFGGPPAYANPDVNPRETVRPTAGVSRGNGASGGVAVYNIAAHTVTLPNGTQLEAHSGLGELFDQPSGVSVRMKGATPPALYNLRLRESLFHGVQALRLTPTDSTVYGRSGLLAHTFMLGQRGDSNGCVSFRNYKAFLEAFREGEVRQLKVIRGDGSDSVAPQRVAHKNYPAPHR